MKTIHIVKHPQRLFKAGTARFRAWHLLLAFNGLSVASFVKACHLMEKASGSGGDPGGWVKFFTATGKYADRAGNTNASERLAEVRTQARKKETAKTKPQRVRKSNRPAGSSRKARAAIKNREENVRRTAVLAGEDPEVAVNRIRGLGDPSDEAHHRKKRASAQLSKKRRKKSGAKKAGYKKADAMWRRLPGSFESGRH